jgi:hypothetical protein
MEKSKSSYLMNNLSYDIKADLTLREYTNFSKDLIHLPNFFSEEELNPLKLEIDRIRNTINFTTLEPHSVGKVNQYKYICHQVGRYDIWPVADNIKTPDFLKDYKRKSIGCLYLDKHTLADGKYHKDTVDLFADISNNTLPPFYYNMLVATCEQTLINGPTVFLLDETLWWVNLKKGDALIFNGEILHRGTRNISDMNRDLIYVIYTKEWYDEEIF